MYLQYSNLKHILLKKLLWESFFLHIFYIDSLREAQIRISAAILKPNRIVFLFLLFLLDGCN